MMDKNWLTWTKENLARGCKPEEVLAVLLKQKLQIAEIRVVMGEKFPADSQLLKGRLSGNEAVKLKGTWLKWATENLERGCDPEEILATLLQNKFPVSEIREVMDEKFPEDSKLLKGLK